MKLVRVEELFAIERGPGLDLNALETLAQGVPYVSTTANNNGVAARVASLPGVQPCHAGTISVALVGNAMVSFLQEEPYYTAQNIDVLTPKEPMSRATLLFYCACLRANQFRFSYGRKANRTMRTLLVPSIDNVPAWAKGAFQEPGSVWHDIMHGGLRLGEANAANRLPAENWGSFVLGELFEIRRGAALTKDEMTPGSTPHVGASAANNGVTALIGQAPMHPGGLITVSCDGSIGEAFLQPKPFWASSIVNVLYPRFELKREVALFFVTLIRLEKYRYNYGRKWRLEVMRSTKLRLPVKADGTPDFAAMEAVMRACPSGALLGSF